MIEFKFYTPTWKKGCVEKVNVVIFLTVYNKVNSDKQSERNEDSKQKNSNTEK